ncbi:MAG: hypothetical protein AB1806_18125 [Acidobacteriota bacterium]
MSGDQDPAHASLQRPLLLLRNVGRLAARRTVRASNLARKALRRRARAAARMWRATREAGKNAMVALRNLSRWLWRRLLGLHKPFVRRWRRMERAREQAAWQRRERKTERGVRRLAASGRPILLGPWLSEVGFETFYWVPFLRWLKAEHNWDPQRVVAVSRGGVRSWYSDLAADYVDVFDVMDPPTFARRSQERREAGEGTHKQLDLAVLDRDILDFARQATGRADAIVIHPSAMYRLFRAYWLGHRPVNFVLERVRHIRPAPPSTFDLSFLPRRYVAVKAYTAASLPDTPRNRLTLQAIVEHLADHIDVVTLDTGLAIDDHDDYLLSRHSRVHSLAGLLTPANNLELQTQVISRAEAFVGTCGSLTWLAPLLGIPTVALMSDSRFLYPHLYLARQVYLQQGAALFATVDVNAAGPLHIGLDRVLDGTHAQTQT